ncbi:hypothetical protein E2C01_055446 [Portunus trituberculatus]|uniref:Uncharacterized protein n=1 Tax=Portunus trituberculatus TaxID=210409 RepID=A0A5B7GXR3_PORTR|nr:hypothetical protein [Portunus trituberculatus]
MGSGDTPAPLGTPHSGRDRRLPPRLSLAPRATLTPLTPDGG